MSDSKPRIRPGAGEIEKAAIERLHAIYSGDNKRGETSQTVINDLTTKQEGLMRQNGFMRGDRDSRTGNLPFIDDGELANLAKDAAVTKRLVETMYAYDEAINAAQGWATSQNGDYWNQRTFQHRQEHMGEVGTRTGNVKSAIAQKRIELGLDKPSGREIVFR